MDDGISDEAKLVKRERATECPICFTPFNASLAIPKRLECVHLHCLQCCEKMFQRQGEKFHCGICRQPTQIKRGRSVNESLATDYAFLELCLRFSEVNAEIGSMQNELIVLRRERVKPSAQSQNLFEQQDESMDDDLVLIKWDTVIDQAVVDEAGPSSSRCPQRFNHLGGSDKDAPPVKVVMLSSSPMSIPSPRYTPLDDDTRDGLEDCTGKNTARRPVDDRWTITLSRLRNQLRQPPLSQGERKRVRPRGQRSNVHVPDGDGEVMYHFLSGLFREFASMMNKPSGFVVVCSPLPGDIRELVPKLFIHSRSGTPNSDEFKAVGKNIFLVFYDGRPADLSPSPSDESNSHHEKVTEAPVADTQGPRRQTGCDDVICIVDSDDE